VRESYEKGNRNAPNAKEKSPLDENALGRKGREGNEKERQRRAGKRDAQPPKQRPKKFFHVSCRRKRKCGEKKEKLFGDNGRQEVKSAEDSITPFSAPAQKIVRREMGR